MSFGKLIVSKIKDQKNKNAEDKYKDQYKILQHREGDCQFQIKYKDLDKYGIVCDYLSVIKGTPILDVTLINKKLEAQAESVQKKITYLLEDFKLIELDIQNKRAQLRSYPPHEKEDSKFYYEIVLDEGTRAHFQRYEYSRSRRRFEKITSQLTLETFERLIDNLVELLC